MSNASLLAGKTLICLLWVAASVGVAQDWPQWRGPQANGLTATKLPAEWGQDKNIAWKVAIPGKGWSQPVVWGNKIFVTTAVTESQAQPTAGNFDAFTASESTTSGRGRWPMGPGGFRGPGGLGGGFGAPSPPPDKVYLWKLICLDGATGKVLWEKTAHEGKPRATVNQNNTCLWQNKQRVELITAGGTKLRSQSPESGELFWEMDAGGRNSLTPVGDQELLYADSVDRMMGGRGPLVAIRAGASRDISLKEDETANEHVAWSVPLRTYRVSSPLLYEGYLYMLDQQRGLVRC